MDLTSRIIWTIEMQLKEPLDLSRLSDLCAASPYHLVRVFRAGTGMGPITYLRARRLTEAARALAAGEDDILSLALSLDYASHEAFTRAFTRYFDLAPRDVRRLGSLDMLEKMEPLKMKMDMIVDVDPPEIQTRDGMRVVGLNLRCSHGNTEGIPGLWQKLNSSETEVPGRVAGAAFGVCHGGDGQGNFQYLAGYEVTGDAPVPDGMEEVTIAPQRYAVFTHRGHIGDFPKTVYTIWNKALPDAGLTPVQAPDLERYGADFDPATGRGEIQVWIPVSEI